MTSRIFAGYVIKLTTFRHSSQYDVVNIIHETVEYLLNSTGSPESSRLDMVEQLCKLTSDHADLGPLVVSEQTIAPISAPTGLLDFSLSRTRSLQHVLTATIHLGFSSLAQTLIDEGVKDFKSPQPYWTQSCFGTALFSAIRQNQINLVSSLLKTQHLFCNWTHVFQAGLSGNEAMVDLVLAHPSVDIAREASTVALKGAIAGDHINTIHHLIRKHFSQNPFTKIHDDKWGSDARTGPASYHDNESFLEYFLNEAVVHGRERLVNLALSHGAKARSVAMSRKGPNMYFFCWGWGVTGQNATL